MDHDLVDFMSDKLGISGVANIIGAIKTAKHYDLASGENILVVATDSLSRYHSVMDAMPDLSMGEIQSIYERVVKHQEPSYFFEGDRDNRLRWHNLKYYTWIEQQGKTVEALNEMLYQEFWENEANKVQEVDELILKYRKENHQALYQIMEL